MHELRIWAAGEKILAVWFKGGGSRRPIRLFGRRGRRLLRLWLLHVPLSRFARCARALCVWEWRFPHPAG
jgi:hypothetical protein